MIKLFGKTQYCVWDRCIYEDGSVSRYWVRQCDDKHIEDGTEERYCGRCGKPIFKENDRE